MESELRVDRDFGERTIQGSGKTSGFTLIEVIVTLTLLGFIVLIIFGAFRLGLAAWERGETTRGEYQKIRTVSQMISRQIKSAVPYKVKTTKAEGDYLAFEGKARSVRFVSALGLKAMQSEGFVHSVYEFREDGGRFVLFEQRVLNKDFFEEDLKEDRAVALLEGISDIRFEYFREENAEENEAESWVDEWSAKEKKKLPRAVRTTIHYKNGKAAKAGTPFTFVASVPAYQFEEVRTTLIGPGRRPIQQIPTPDIRP
jgi:general secretion pathway protein J